MLLNSFKFYLLFPFIFLVFWGIPQKHQSVKKYFLIIISYLLYLNWKPFFALILFGITLTTFYSAKYIQGHKSRKLILFFVFLTLSPLLLFKYYNFINEIGTSVLSFCGLNFSLPGLNWAIPIGISFYTFQAVGYLLDVYFGKCACEHKFSNYLLFCSFFPQTVSGPISKATELLPQIAFFKPFNYSNAVAGLQYLLWGVFLKSVVADRLGIFVDLVYGNYQHFSGANCLIASFFYSIQIYGDFAGYSLMAIGIAKTLNIDLVNNFERPYLAESVSLFWRKWHISLTRWLTTYVYIPLGGSRCSKFRQYVNIMITFLVSGIWHGANWTFIIWGGLHGLFQIIEKTLGIAPKGRFSQSSILIRLKPIRILFTFSLVTFAWIFFRMPNISDALSLIKRILFDFNGQVLLGDIPPREKAFYILIVFFTVISEIIVEFFPEKIKKLTTFPLIRWMFYISIFAVILTCGVLDAGQFIYASF